MTASEKNGARRSVPVFGAILLILIGAIWLLVSTGTIAWEDVAVLLNLWPILLILLGINLLFSANYPVVSYILVIVAVVIALGAILFGDQLGLTPDVNIEEAQYSEPLEDARSAEINLKLEQGKINLAANTDSNDLISADIMYLGESTFTVDGTTEKIVTLETHQNTSVADGLSNLPGVITSLDDMISTILLNPNIPLTINVSGGVGDSELDLSALILQDLIINSGVGSVTLMLPESDTAYTVDIDGGVGSMQATLPDNTDISMTIDSGVGSFTLHIPESAAVQVEVEQGVGGVTMPSGYVQVGGNDDVSIWESENYDSAEERITINYDGGVGSFTIDHQ